jgi:hypothetical protein
MSAIVIVVLGLLVLAIGLAFTLGAGPLAAIPVIVLLAVGGWMLWAFAHGASPATTTRRVKKAELLGPGGPDDPDRNANRSDT